MKNMPYPCLWFDNQAMEAAKFYCSLFPNSQVTESTSLVTVFSLNGNRLMGLNGGPVFSINPSISIYVQCQSIEKTNHLWNQLMEGGKAMMEIGEYPWSPCYGWLSDRYGVTWQISVANERNPVDAISPSMLFTGNNFGRAEEAVNFYTQLFDQSKPEVMLHYEKGSHYEGKVLFSEFKLNGKNIIAMDGPGEHQFNFNEGVSFVVECEDQNKIDYYWNHLVEGGKESRCGWLQDKFGVSWQIIPEGLGKLFNDPQKGPRVGAELMKMNKIILQKLLDA